MQQLDSSLTIKSLVSFIQNIFSETGFSKAVVALSGGIDSATSCALAVRALGSSNVYPLLLPYGTLNDKGVEDALSVANTLEIPRDNVQIINIQPIVDQIVSCDSSMNELRKGNSMARTRMIMLYDQAKKRNALVIGTENKSEHYLGYFTRFGDEASDLEPLRNLYKTEVYQLASHLNLPKQVLEKAPSAGLWEGQTDEEEFGFSYKEADQILFLAVDEGKGEREIIEAGFSKEVVQRVLARKENYQFKLALPYVPST